MNSKEITKDEDEKMIHATEGLTNIVTDLVHEFIQEVSDDFPDNPSIPYTVVLDTLASTIGQLLNVYPEESRDKILHHVVEIIVNAQHLTAKHQNVNMMRTVGSA